jgi:hypothetical protein
MVKLLSVARSPLTQKKWRATFDDGTHTDFGDANLQDYTQHKNKARRTLYLARHAKDLATGDPRRAGYLSYYILWGPSTSFDANIRFYKNKFNM